MSGAQFAREITIAFAPETLWAEIVRDVVPIARADRESEIAAGNFGAAYDTLVNGRADAPEESLQPGGAIVYRARSIGAAVAMALDYLRRNSPDRVAGQGRKHNTSTRYRDSFMVGISRGAAAGRAIPAASFDPDLVTADATEAFIYSPLPFSRLVDVQMEGGRQVRFTIDAGLFDRTAAQVRRAYPALYTQRIYNLDHPGKYRPKTAKVRAFHSPGVVIRAER
jgi:hypothetical protein